MDDINKPSPIVEFVSKHKIILVVIAITNISTFLVSKYLSIEKDIKQETKEIVVELSGSVYSPGTYKASSEQRVGELIELAGGFTEDADIELISKSFNLSKKITDEEKIYVPYYWEDQKSSLAAELVKSGDSDEGEQGNSSESTNEEASVGENSIEGGLVNINTASNEELDALPGIGPVYAHRIVDGRPYSDSADFVDRSGLSKSVADKLENLISY